MRTGFCWGNLMERLHLEDPGIDGRIILNRKNDGWAWPVLIWLRTGIGCGLL